MKPPFLRTEFNYDSATVSVETGLECKDPSRAVQSQAEEADINTIVRRFGLTGQLPQNVRPPLAGDFYDIEDFQSAQNAILAATQSFNAMPAEVRSRFENDPAQFYDFCTDTDATGKLINLEEMRKLGLAVPSTPPASAPAA